MEITIFKEDKQGKKVRISQATNDHKAYIDPETKPRFALIITELQGSQKWWNHHKHASKRSKEGEIHN